MISRVRSSQHALDRVPQHGEGDVGDPHPPKQRVIETEVSGEDGGGSRPGQLEPALLRRVVEEIVAADGDIEISVLAQQHVHAVARRDTGSRSASPQECLENLLTKVSFYGFSERFEEFAVTVGYLLGLRNVLPVPEENVTADIPNPHNRQARQSLTAEELAQLGEILRDDLWFHEQALAAYRHRMADPRLAELLATSAPLLAACRDARRQCLTIKDTVRTGHRGPRLA